MSERFSPLSRRGFLASMSASLLLPTELCFATEAPATSTTQFVYIGTYTGAPGNGGSGEGIYVCTRDRASGELSRPKLVAKAASPSCLAVHPSQRFLYASNETTSYAGAHGKGGSVSSYAVESATGELHELNAVSSEGAGPAYVSLDRSGRFALVANYDSGSIAVLPISPDGQLGSAVDVRQDAGSVGPRKATTGPPASFAISGHEGPHAHMVQASPDNNFVLSSELGQDRLYVQRFDAATGKLTAAADPSYGALPAGDGPRHFAFHPNGRWVYSIQEEASTLVLFALNTATGALAAQQTISTLPPGFQGTSFTSEVLVSRDGRFVYAANRLHDTIAILRVGAGGHLTWTDEVSTLGDYPAAFSLSPDGGFLYALNLRSDAITCFRVDKRSGTLHFTGHYTGVGSPGSMVFLG